MAALDLLPAGLEIEMPLAGDDGKPYSWLGSLDGVTVEEARDDRFVAAFNIGSEEQPDPKKPPPLPPGFRLGLYRARRYHRHVRDARWRRRRHVRARDPRPHRHGQRDDIGGAVKASTGS